MWALVEIIWLAAKGRAGAERVLTFKTREDAESWVKKNYDPSGTTGYDIVVVESG